jgi:hypothetical protein
MRCSFSRWVLASLALVVVIAGPLAARPSRPPNIVLILSDDKCYSIGR